MMGYDLIRNLNSLNGRDKDLRFTYEFFLFEDYLIFLCVSYGKKKSQKNKLISICTKVKTNNLNFGFFSILNNQDNNI